MKEGFLSPKLNLSTLPTPLEELKNLGKSLGIELLLKRDDLTTPGGGGNKVRKLEFLFADAIRAGAKTVLTIGGVQSNHCRQTALLARKLNLEPYLVLMGNEPETFQGNLLLDQLAGAQIYFSGSGRKAGEELLGELFRELKEKGKEPYLIPYGGSNEIGVQGYISAWLELKEQAERMGKDFDYIVLAASSGGTMAGILLGQALTESKARCMGISVGPKKEELREEIVELFERTSKKLNIEKPLPEFFLFDEFVGPGYGVLDGKTAEAILTLSQREGILLDPVYTGKAFKGLLGLLERGEIGGRVLFWHTGGIPALFAYSEIFKTRFLEEKKG